MERATDYIVLIAFTYFFIRGWLKGFLRSLLGPIALVAAGIVGIIYYTKSQNLMMALLISILGPFPIVIAGSLLLKFWHKSVNDGKELSTLSQISGSLFCLSWRGTMLILTLILITLIPSELEFVTRVKDNIINSRSYSLISRHIIRNDQISNFDFKNVTEVLEDSNKRKALESTDEYQAVMADDQIQEILKDEEVLKMLQEKNYPALLSNPKMQALFGDKDLLKKMFSLNQQIMEESMKKIDKANEQR